MESPAKKSWKTSSSLPTRLPCCNLSRTSNTAKFTATWESAPPWRTAALKDKSAARSFGTAMPGMASSRKAPACPPVAGCASNLRASSSACS
eukprot:2942063-Amphidinium_carterae.1